MQSSKIKAKDGTDIELVDSRITDARISEWDGKQGTMTAITDDEIDAACV